MTEWLRFFDKPRIRAADALRDQRRWADAIDAYRDILQRRPARPAVWVQIGHCLNHLQRWQEAIEAYRAADLLRPDDPDTLFHLASAHERLCDVVTARELYSRVLALQPARADILKGAMLGARKDAEKPEWLDYVIIGTTGLCNASCIHCPTGKLSTANSPRTPMPMPLFRKIIDEIADSGMKVAGNINFGLFGDGLVDPHVVERARYVRERLPDVILDINTNGAAYDPKKHAALNDYANVISLHCESLIPDVYDYLMQPLRAERVQAKYPLIFRDFPGKVLVSVPTNRLNADERPAMRDFFYGLGATSVEFSPMANRLANDEELFNRISFAPEPIRCEPRILYNLIVDCDGTVLACCNDFARIEPIGNLAEDSLDATLGHQRRLAFRDKLAKKCHADLSTCSRCRGDTPVSIPPIKESLPTAA